MQICFLMNFFVLLYFSFYAIFFLVIAIPFFLLILWAIDKWILKRKLKLVYRILLSLGIPVILIGLAFLDLYYAPYSTKSMDERLESLVPEVHLPPYKITDYSSIYVGGDDLKDTYEMAFKDGKDESLKRTLDSLANSCSKWKNNNGVYVYDTTFFENEIVDSIIIRPLDGTATFIRYKW